MTNFFIPKNIIDETLANSPTPGKKLLEPLKSFGKESGLPINILEDMDIVNEAEVHAHEADLWGCLEGEVTFIYGGELLNPRTKKNPDGSFDERELRAKETKGGTTVILRPGDWLYIPAGEPHQHSAKGVARLYIIKIPKV